MTACGDVIGGNYGCAPRSVVRHTGIERSATMAGAARGARIGHMRREALRQRANLAIAGAATLFLPDLFLNWHPVAMHMGGVVDVRTTASGWSGWGAIAGICAPALLV